MIELTLMMDEPPRKSRPLSAISSVKVFTPRNTPSTLMSMIRRQSGRKQPGMIMALNHIERVGRDVLARHIPGIVVAIGIAVLATTPEPNALALAQSVEGQADMLTQDVALRGHHRAGPERQVTIQKFAKWSFADEANAGRILLAGVRQCQFTGDATDIGLLQFAQWEECS